MTKVADITLKQLGGNKFIAMTGAKNLLSRDAGQSLSFQLSSRLTSNKSNYVKITLNSNDLYDVYFGKIFKYDLKDISTFTNVGCENLVQLFEQETGLYTKLF